MKNTIEYIKHNKLYLLIMLIGSIAFGFQMNQVVLYADDFVFGAVSNDGLKAIFEYFIKHYLTWGGGLSDSIATIFLLFDFSVWKIFQCILITTMIILATRVITYETGKSL